MKPLTLLHLEDNPEDAELIRRILLREWPDACVSWAQAPADFLAALEKGSVDLILSDCRLQGFSGFEALRLAKQRRPDTPFLFVTGTIGEDQAIEAVRLGVDDYIFKDRLKRLVTAVARALRDAADRRERKRLEEQFLRAQRMENLGLLAAGIAHDLNNMLAPILLATPMLRDQVAEAHGQKLLDTLECSAERGSHLVRQILSFAHGVGGEHHLLQVKHLMRDVASIMHGTFPKSIQLQEYVPADLWTISGNPTQIHQVLFNLCVNARDAMPNGGVLKLVGENVVLSEADAARLDGGRPGAFTALHVEDSGMGIPPEVLPQIWQPFFTTKAADKGTGLGLSTVRGIVEAHGGFVEVRSILEVGSTFRVYFPAVDAELPEDSPGRAPGGLRGKGELILVVDDEEQIREMTSTVLRRFGYRVLLAADGVEAAAIFARRAGEIRLVISDLHMPKLDGAMLSRALRRVNPDARVLVISGMASSLGNQYEFRAEDFADGLLLKPFKAETLLERVAEILRPESRPPGRVKSDVDLLATARAAAQE